MSIYYIQNYRKAKDKYLKSDELYISIRYYSDRINDGRLLTLSTGIKCKIKDWDSNWSKTHKREPVKRTDKDYKKKNLLLKQKETKIKNIISQLQWDNKIPNVGIVKSYLRKEKVTKRINSITEIHFLILLDLFYNHINTKNNITSINTKRTTNSSIKDVKRFSFEYQIKNKIKLLVSDIDDEWMWEFIRDCDKRKLQPSTIKKRLGILSQFGKWCNKEHKINYVISRPSNFIVKSKKDIIFFNREEVNKLISFEDFNINNPEHEKHLTFNHKKIEYIYDRVNTKKNNGKVKYSSYEVYKDMLLFLCGTGMRFGDMVKLRMDDYTFREGNRTEGTFSFMMEKTNTMVSVPIEGYVHEIWKKYSKSKKYRQGYYVFPRTKFTNPISNQKFNKHIKEICKIIKLNRQVNNPKFTLEGKIDSKNNEKFPIWEVVTSHIGRRTFIREHIQIETSPRIIMKMTGHRSQKVFDGYYDILESDIEGINRNIYKKLPEINTDESQTNLSLKDKLKELKDLLEEGLIPKEIYTKKVSELMS